MIRKNLSMKRQSLSKKNHHILRILFITWFLYSAGVLGFMAFNDKIPQHCTVLGNNGYLL